MSKQTMDLPSTLHFQGWNIKYSLRESSHTPSTSSSSSSIPTQPKNVVFVHGTPWSSAVYGPIISALLARGPYRILVYDLPGYGQSQHYSPDSSNATEFRGFEGDTSVAFQAKALAALIAHVGMDVEGSGLAVVAHDIAGAVVLRAHLLHGVGFESMLLMDTNAVLPWGDGFYKLARAEAGTFVKMPPAVHEAVVRAVVCSAWFNPKVVRAGWEDVLAEPWIDGDDDGSAETEKGERQRSFVRQIAQANDRDVAEMLEGEMYSKVKCDVKVLWGEQDQWIPREKMEELIRRLDGRVKEFVVVPEAGHLLMLDQPARVAVEVFDWLSSR